jgi:hypothetical protein
VPLYVLPIDDTSVYYLEKAKMKKFRTAEKLDVILDVAAKYNQR